MTFRFLCAAALFVTACGASHAEGPVEAGPDIDAGLNPGGKKPLWELGLGVAGLRLPDYRGSDQSRGYLVPLPYVVYRGTWLKADRDGARALLLETQRVKVDVSVAASTPTRSRDNVAREGMPTCRRSARSGPTSTTRWPGPSNTAGASICACRCAPPSRCSARRASSARRSRRI